MLPSISCFLDSIRARSPLSTAVTPPARISSTRPSTSTRSAPSAAMPIALPATPTSVSTVRPVKVSRSRTSCLNRSSSKAGGGSTRERAADRKLTGDSRSTHVPAPGHFHRRGSLLQPGIEVLDPLPKVEADPDNDRSGPGALAKDTPKLSALHLDVVGPLDPGPQRRTEPLQGTGGGQPHEDRDESRRDLRVTPHEKRDPQAHSAGRIPTLSATSLSRGLEVGGHHGEVGGPSLRQSAEAIVRGGKLIVGLDVRHTPAARPLFDRSALP